MIEPTLCRSSVDFLQQFQNSLPPFRWSFLFLPLPLFFTMALDALGWRFLFPASGRPTYRSLLKAQIGTEAIFLSIPGGFAAADIAKVMILRKREGVETADSAASLVARRWILGISQITFLILCFGFDFGVMKNGLSRLLAGTNLGMVACAFIVLAAVALGAVTRLVVLGRFAGTLYSTLLLLPIPPVRRLLARHEESFRRADECFRELGSGSKLVLSLSVLLYLATWVTEALETFLVARYMGLGMSLTQVLIVEAILSIVKEAVFFLPSGIVVKDLGYITLFSAFSIVISPVQMLTFIVIKRFVMLLWVVVGFGLLLAEGVLPSVRQRVSKGLVIAEQEQ